ncbi:hypothetical protein GCM10008995_21090 [Halobellus salinus]|uniref:Uncharacterized protein n=1 Tax=Halobellus salinus TaxID=931585 RepID=A0A830EHL0_9EURY|nr:hypothetical protein GCM10008995_21090 [Halobellus salinus]
MPPDGGAVGWLLSATAAMRITGNEPSAVPPRRVLLRIRTGGDRRWGKRSIGDQRDTVRAVAWGWEEWWNGSSSDGVPPVKPLPERLASGRPDPEERTVGG